MKNIPTLSAIKLKFSVIIFLMTLSFSVFAQEVDDELPTAFFGNWVEDISQCDAGSYFSVANSEIGLLVFGLGWSSTEVKVKSMGSYYTLFVNGVSEGGDFESEIKIKMGDDGNLFFIDSDSEEIELVKCDPIESDVVVELEYEIEEIILGDTGLEVVELNMENNKDLIIYPELPVVFYDDLENSDFELPSAFYGNWVEYVSQCDAGSYFSVANSEIGLLVFGLGWSSTEVKVKNMGSYYTLFVNGVSEGGDFESEIKIKMGDDGNLFFIDSDSEEIELVKCDPIESDVVVELEYEIEDIILGDTGLEVVELNMENNKDLIIYPELPMVIYDDLENSDFELPSAFYGNWVEDLTQCEIASILSIVDSEEGLVVSGYEWSAEEVKVKNIGDFYILQIKGSSSEGGFESEVFIKMDEEGNLLVVFDEDEIENKLVRCSLNENEEFIEMELVDTVLAVEEFDMVQFVDLETFNIELLQGKWQSIEDEASFMVIEGDRMKNYYGGMDDELDNEMIMISDTCLNEYDSENDLPEEKSKYLSNPNLDMCWYIEFVDTTSLSLIYMATGNTLTYRRVE